LTQSGENVRLTHTESQLLTLFVRRRGITLSREELCQHCGIDAGGRAIDVQIARLRRKIEADPGAPRYLVTVWGEGYTLRAV
jgi:two-component system phosphate regulon response regulator OmpR